nr:hypothetical protein Iba_chr05dCG2060 [Ipomoea batatas]GMD00803.1 hypothetical protein Iba_chr05fCG1340 [Ipomoea batatas]GME17788.1 hypothetical protein Iba_scaffold19475CG0010 [Ipomoea batatas]
MVEVSICNFWMIGFYFLANINCNFQSSIGSMRVFFRISNGSIRTSCLRKGIIRAGIMPPANKHERSNVHAGDDRSEICPCQLYFLQILGVHCWCYSRHWIRARENDEIIGARFYSIELQCLQVYEMSR